MIVRTNMGAHKDYASVRAASELLALFGEHVPSLTKESTQPFCCKVKASFSCSSPPQLAAGESRTPAWGSIREFLDATADAAGAECPASPSAVPAPTKVTKVSVLRNHLCANGASQVLAIALGIADASMPLGGRISLRWESPEFVIFDSPLCWSPLHLMAMPTAWFIPFWMCLMERAEVAKEMLAKMKRALLEVALTFLRHKEWRESFYGEVLPSSLEDEELLHLCEEHAIAGFIWPAYGNQMCLQFILPPLFAWHWSRQDHFSSARWVPLEVVSARLEQRLKAEVDDSFDLASEKQMWRTFSRVRADKSQQERTSSELHSQCQERYKATQEHLMNWASMCEAVATESEYVHMWSKSGCLKQSFHKVDDVLKEDEKRLSSYGCPRNGSEPVGTFYGYPKRPEEISMEFVCESK
mmetsp:Transcript_7227/g.12956  ORF Transcript_7227/g.12956 Transcript_7227/m.12956 type:complete len:413 (+) Transcript_7227:3-1241(+)